MKMKDGWRLALDQKKIVRAVAFDLICHNRLLAKFRAYGVSDTVVQLLRSCLEGRKQRIKDSLKILGVTLDRKLLSIIEATH